MICIPLSAATNADMAELLRRAGKEPADAHELRLDSLREPPNVEELVAASSRPVVATCRSRREGGAFEGADADRRDILLRAARAGAAYLDAEAMDVPLLKDRGSAVLIASLHDFRETPADLDAKVRDLASLPADWVKFATAANSPADNLRVFSAIRRCPKPCIGLAMGEVGLMSRILGLSFGSRLTYGSLEAGRESAPGQPTSRDLADLYQVKRIGEETEIYGLLANPVAQSKGYILHNRAFAELQVDAVYIPFLSRKAAEFLDFIPDALNVRGLSVSIPHKQAALAWAKQASESARRIGAANTLTLTGAGWRADNTDCQAVFESIKAGAGEAGLKLIGAPALVLGSGGTARAVGVALTLLGCRVSVTARDASKGCRLTEEMGWEYVSWSDAIGGAWTLIANTTPVGMYPNVDETPFPDHAWRPGMLAFDAVANPAETRFLREAAAAGAATVNGEEMFVRQAEGQLRLWTGRN